MAARLKKFALALGVFGVSVLIAELAVRWSATPSFDSAMALERARLTVAKLSGATWNPKAREPDNPTKPDAGATGKAEPLTLLLQPFYGFDVANADSIATTESSTFSHASAPKNIDILILGGSVAGSFGNECYNELRGALQALPAWRERGVRVFSAGRGGFRQPQQLHMLEYMLEIGYRPDIVIELDGFNEVALGLQNARAGVHPVMPSISHWAAVTSKSQLGPRVLDAILDARKAQQTAEQVLNRAEQLGLFHSAIATRLTQRLLDQSYARFSKATVTYAEEKQKHEERNYLIGPTFDSSDASAIRISANVWSRSSLEMDAICRLWNIRYVQLLQPTLHDEGSKPTTENERKVGAQPEVWVLGAKLGYPQLRARGALLAARGVEFYDLSQLFSDVKEELYYDVCHFVHAGHEILLKRVVEILNSKPPEPFVPPEKEH